MRLPTAVACLTPLAGLVTTVSEQHKGDAHTPQVLQFMLTLQIGTEADGSQN